MSDRLFDVEEYPEIPLFRPPRSRKSEGDVRFRGDYPPEWWKCQSCDGSGQPSEVVKGYWDPERGVMVHPISFFLRAGSNKPLCDDCNGMGSLRARVRFSAGHRCERCRHPYIPKNDAAMLGVEPSFLPGGWSRCDTECRHGGPVRLPHLDESHPTAKAYETLGRTVPYDPPPFVPVVRDGNRDDLLGELDVALGLDGEFDPARAWREAVAAGAEAAWRILTVHHASGDKASTSDWDLCVLCQRCHLEVQAKVVLERVYPHEHSSWFKWHAAGWYAFSYLGEDLTKPQIMERLDELLALELAAWS